MLAIYLTDESICYAQLVNYQGQPFIESTGTHSLKQGISPSDAANPDLRVYLAETIAEIRNSVEFPDSKTYVVVDSSWFPLQFHSVDKSLSDKDLVKFLNWRGQEMLDKAAGQFDIIHQPLAGPVGTELRPYMSLARPQGFQEWIARIIQPSELEIERIVLDLEAVGALLAYGGTFASDQRTLVLENKKDMLRCRVYANQDIEMVFDLGVTWDFHVIPERIRGDRVYVEQVMKSLRTIFRDPADSIPDIGKIFLFNADGDPSFANNLLKSPSIEPLELAKRFNFREAGLDNPDPFAVPLGILALEVQERFNAD